MRSWLTGMPGEIVSCVGCHEGQNETPRLGRTMASIRPPGSRRHLKVESVLLLLNLEVQPILDRACVACHDGSLKRNYIGGRIDKMSPAIAAIVKVILICIHTYTVRGQRQE
jgi:hypothetical protein